METRLGKRKARGEYVKKIVGRGVLDVLAFCVSKHLCQRDVISLKHAFQFAPYNKKFLTACGKRITLPIKSEEQLKAYKNGVWPRIAIGMWPNSGQFTFNRETEVVALQTRGDPRALVLDVKYVKELSIARYGIPREQTPDRLYNADNLRRLNVSTRTKSPLLEFSTTTPALKELTIEHSTDSTLPSWVWKMNNLIYLKIKWSAVKVIPPEIANLSQLLRLEFAGCRFLKTLPRELSMLPKLKSIDIRGVWFDKVPHELAILSSLRQLRISPGASYLKKNLLELFPGVEIRIG